eukprot:gnl/TRDRNA2_/TRDRNA2_129114_c0_seq1.p1 gnl/TRDRNA2_/TRDRNA2_129114_c0~~gnl/TRDRNA2_/TRDRNA2_129114_c0_seq1.p1  ORF type:complete len:495 (-),score=72.50 gnl/TRDRNA2_/TRDRNA2_129114_c0_seq1:129-1613(-)
MADAGSPTASAAVSGDESAFHQRMSDFELRVQAWKRNSVSEQQRQRVSAANLSPQVPSTMTEAMSEVLIETSMDGSSAGRSRPDSKATQQAAVQMSSERRGKFEEATSSSSAPRVSFALDIGASQEAYFQSNGTTSQQFVQTASGKDQAMEAITLSPKAGSPKENHLAARTRSSIASDRKPTASPPRTRASLPVGKSSTSPLRRGGSLSVNTRSMTREPTSPTSPKMVKFGVPQPFPASATASWNSSMIQGSEPTSPCGGSRDSNLSFASTSLTASMITMEQTAENLALEQQQRELERIIREREADRERDRRERETDTRTRSSLRESGAGVKTDELRSRPRDEPRFSRSFSPPDHAEIQARFSRSFSPPDHAEIQDEKMSLQRVESMMRRGRVSLKEVSGSVGSLASSLKKEGRASLTPSEVHAALSSQDADAGFARRRSRRSLDSQQQQRADNSEPPLRGLFRWPVDLMKAREELRKEIKAELGGRFTMPAAA